MFELPKDPSQIKPDVFRKKCPARCLLNKISGKWGINAACGGYFAEDAHPNFT